MHECGFFDRFISLFFCGMEWKEVGGESAEMRCIGLRASVCVRDGDAGAIE